MTALSDLVHSVFPVPSGAFSSVGSKRVLGSILVDTVGTGMFMSLVLLYLVRVNHITPMVAGPIITTSAVASFLLMGPIGWFVHAVGGRNALIVCSAISAVGYLLYLWATSLAVVAAAAVLVAIGDRINGTCWPVLAAEQFGRDKLSHVFAITNSAKTLALGVGALTASAALATAGTGGLRIGLFANVSSYVLGLILLLFVPASRTHSSEVKPAHQPITVALRNRPFMQLVVSQTAMSASWIIPGVAFPLYFTGNLGESAALAAAALTFRYGVITAVQVPLVNRVASWSRSRILRVSSASAALGVAAVAALPRVHAGALLVAVVIATGLLAGSEIVSKPTAAAEAMRLAGAGVEAPYMAVFQVSWTLAYALGPAAIGLGLEVPPVLWGSIFVIVVIGAVFGGALRLDCTGEQEKPCPAQN